MKYLCLLFSVFFTQISQAQIDKILKNKDIIWAAEVSSDLVLDDANLAFDSTYNYLYTLKYLPYKSTPIVKDDREYLETEVLSSIFNKKLQIFGDTKLKNSLISLGYRIDSVSLINPSDNISKMSAIVSAVNQPIKIWRFSQIIYFNKKTNKWSSEPISISPIFSNSKPSKNFKRETHVWIPLFKTKKNKINCKNITWVKRTATRYLGNNHLALDSAKILKNMAEPMALFFKDFETNLKNDYYDDGSLIDKNKLTPSVRKSILNQVDTIQVIDPTTMQESLKAVHSDTKAEDIRNLRLVHDWFWDSKKKRLYVRLVGVAPMKSEYGAEGFIYERPLFYQKYD